MKREEIYNRGILKCYSCKNAYRDKKIIRCSISGKYGFCPEKCKNYEFDPNNLEGRIKQLEYLFTESFEGLKSVNKHIAYLQKKIKKLKGSSKYQDFMTVSRKNRLEEVYQNYRKGIPGLLYNLEKTCDYCSDFPDDEYMKYFKKRLEEEIEFMKKRGMR